VLEVPTWLLFILFWPMVCLFILLVVLAFVGIVLVLKKLWSAVRHLFAKAKKVAER